jgi:hypothetical protein
MSAEDSFFADEYRPELEYRTPDGRPKILDPTTGKRTVFTRASSLGEYICDQSHLIQWRERYLARGYGRNEDLAALAGLETYSTGFDMDPTTKSASGKRLDALNERILDRVGIEERADYGTVIHALTEPGNEGYMPVRSAVDVHAFWQCIAVNEMKIGGTELFTVNYELQSAGTFDHLVWHKDFGWCIADKKTGRNINGLGFSVQFVSYARGELHDLVTGQSRPLTDLTGGEPINLEVAILFDVKDGMCKPREIPIGEDLGWRFAKLAAEVRDARKTSGLGNISKRLKATGKADGFREEAVLVRIAASTHEAELHMIWNHYTDLHDSQAIRDALAAKKEEL